MALTKEQIKKFKERLEEMRGQLVGQLQNTAAEVKKPDEATGYSQHQADQGTDDFDRTIGLNLTSAEFGVLKQIDRALEKVEENTYGKCDVSGKVIPLKRLEAVPYATMTVEAQEQHEQGLV